MKTIAIILYIILGIWAVFSFNTEKINLVYRYLIANSISNPTRNLIYSLLTVTLTIGLIIIITKGFLYPIREKSKRIESVFNRIEAMDIPAKNLESTIQYVKIFDRLSAKDNQNFNDKQIIENFIKNSIYIHGNMLKYWAERPDFEFSVFNFTRVTQITALKIKEYKHTILLISHNPEKPNKQIRIFEYDKLPEIDSLKKVVDPIFTEEVLKTIKLSFDNSLLRGYNIDEPLGYCANNDQNSKPEWSWIGIPEPFEKFNFKIILGMAVGFRKEEIPN